MMKVRKIALDDFGEHRIRYRTPLARLEEPATLEDLTFENRFFRVQFNRAGQIISWWDKSAQRQVLPEGTVANQFQAFEDRPLGFDAWDINIYYQDKQ